MVTLFPRAALLRVLVVVRVLNMQCIMVRWGRIDVLALFFKTVLISVLIECVLVYYICYYRNVADCEVIWLGVGCGKVIG